MYDTAIIERRSEVALLARPLATFFVFSHDRGMNLHVSSSTYHAQCCLRNAVYKLVNVRTFRTHASNTGQVKTVEIVAL